MKKLEISQMENLQGGYEPSYDLCITTVTVAQLPFLEILFPKHKILTSFNHF